MVVGGPALGIDFGTTSTVAALGHAVGHPRLVLVDSSPVLPSAVFAGQDGLRTGQDAERSGVSDPAGLEVSPKGRIDDGRVWLGGREIGVVDLVAAVLGRVEQEAGRVAGRPLGNVVLTHPASWGGQRLQVLETSAARAGLQPVTFVAEPVAAAAYFVAELGHRIGPGRFVLVYDLGAGTFDAAVVRARPAGVEVVASDGLDDVGGTDFDALVVDHARALTGDAAAAWRCLDRPRTVAERHARHALWRAARAVKEQLSRRAVADLHIPLVDMQVHVTRDEFERAIAPAIERTAECTAALLRHAGVPTTAVDALLLVGGSSRIPLVSTVLHRQLGIAPTITDQPEVVVAVGSLYTDAAKRYPAPGPPVPTAPPPEVPQQPNVPTLRRTRADRRAVIVGTVLATGAAAGAGALAIRGWQGSAARGRARRTPTVARLDARATLTAPKVYCLAFHPRDAVLAAGGIDGTVQMWDIVTRRPVGEPMRGHDGYVRTVAFSPDGRHLATGGNDVTVRLWNVDERRQVGTPLTGHRTVAAAVSFSADGAVLASGGAEGTVRLWDVATHELIGPPLTGHVGGVVDLTFDPHGGRIVVSAGDDGTVRLWDAARGRAVIDPIAAHTGIVTSVAIAPDGATLASGGVDGRIRLWDPATGRRRGEPLIGHKEVLSMAFSPDSAIIATGGPRSDDTVRLWDATIGRGLSTVNTGHNSEIKVAFSPDGDVLASCSLDDVIRLWTVTR
uniref:Hsp70 family protein n=1 Tax=Virgisporangium ochraceum TaxID=65505 RepID=UPI001EF393B3|nr:Hsp70 family protein [Virgisporangium ochraceum]